MTSPDMMTDDEPKHDDEKVLSDDALGETFDEEVDEEETEVPVGPDEFGAGGDGEEKQWE